MTQPDQGRPVSRGDPEWLVSPGLPPEARQQLRSLLNSERLTPEVADLLAKFMKDLQQIEKATASPEPCPNHYQPCPELTSCGKFWVKATAF